jgi:hypothetical protein
MVFDPVGDAKRVNTPGARSRRKLLQSRSILPASMNLIEQLQLWLVQGPKRFLATNRAGYPPPVRNPFKVEVRNCSRRTARFATVTLVTEGASLPI